MEVEGHGRCLCGDLHPTIALSRSGGTCPNCQDHLFRRVREIEVRSDGWPVARVPRLRRGPTGSRGKRETQLASRAAAAAAMRRLRRIFPEVYRLLYAEERARRDLEPFPIEGPLLDGEAIERSLAELGSRDHGTVLEDPGSG